MGVAVKSEKRHTVRRLSGLRSVPRHTPKSPGVLLFRTLLFTRLTDPAVPTCHVYNRYIHCTYTIMYGPYKNHKLLPSRHDGLCRGVHLPPFPPLDLDTRFMPPFGYNVGQSKYIGCYCIQTYSFLHAHSAYTTQTPVSLPSRHDVECVALGIHLPLWAVLGLRRGVHLSPFPPLHLELKQHSLVDGDRLLVPAQRQIRVWVGVGGWVGSCVRVCARVSPCANGVGMWGIGSLHVQLFRNSVDLPFQCSYLLAIGTFSAKSKH